MTATQTKIIALASFLILGLMAGGYFLSIKPMMDRTAQANEAAEAAEAQTQTLNATLTGLKAKQDNIAKAQSEYRRLARQFPDAFIAADWAAMLNRTAQRHGVQIVNLSPSVPTAVAPSDGSAPPPAAAPGQTPAVALGEDVTVAQSDVIINVEGSLANITAFMNQITSLERPLLVGGISVTHDESREGATANAEIRGVAFLMRDLPLPDDQADTTTEETPESTETPAP